jgi:MFS family permease
MLSTDKSNHKLLLFLVFAWAFTQGGATPLIGLSLQHNHPLGPAILTGLYFLGAVLFFPFPQMLMKKYSIYFLAKIAVFLGLFCIVPMGFGLSIYSLAVCRVMQGISSTLLLVSVETELLTTSSSANRAGALGNLEICLVVGGGTGAAMAPLAWSINPFLAGVIPAIPALVALISPFQLITQTTDSSIKSDFSGMKLSSTAFFLIMTAMAQGLVEGVLMAFLTPWLLSNDWNETSISAAFASLFSGIIFSQLFLSRLAGQHRHNHILVLCHLGVAFGFFSLTCPQEGHITFLALFLIGSAIGCQYPVAQAGLAETVSPQQIPLAASIFLASNGLGCLVSSPSGGFIQSYFGTVFLYNSVGIFCLALGLAGLVNCWITRKKTS